MAKTFKHKLGKTRAGEGTRIWLEGQRLIDHGFNCTTKFERVWNAKRGTLTLIKITSAGLYEQLGRASRGVVSGSDARPVIDIVGEAVRAAFPTGHIEATWSQGRVTINGVQHD